VTPVRVLYLLDVLNVVGGTERQLRELVLHMDRSRVEPIAITLYKRDMPHEAEFGGLGCPTTCLELGSLRSAATVRAVFELAAEIRRRRIDIVHTFFPDAGIIGTLAAKLAGARVVVGRRDLGYWYTPGYLRLLRLLQRFADAYIVNSQAVRAVVADSESVGADRIHVVYNGFFDIPEGPSRVSLTDLGFPADSRLVGTVANLRPVKRLDRFVEMAAGVRDPQARFLIVGYGEEQDALVDQARQSGLGDRFRIIHTIPNVLEIVKLFDVGVLTSESEGLSNTLVEYGLAGAPAVAFDVGGNREVIEDSATGFLVRPYDVEAMRRRIEQLLADASLRARLGVRARDLCLDRFAGPRMVEETLAIYERLAFAGS
jgi:glycosyltransferase involved in cell wall biosynthesis